MLEETANDDNGSSSDGSHDDEEAQRIHTRTRKVFYDPELAFRLNVSG